MWDKYSLFTDGPYFEIIEPVCVGSANVIVAYATFVQRGGSISRGEQKMKKIIVRCRKLQKFNLKSSIMVCRKRLRVSAGKKFNYLTTRSAEKNFLVLFLAK